MDTELMDTEITLDQPLAPSITTVRPGEEFSGHHNAATIEQILQASLDDHTKSSNGTTDAPPPADGFGEGFASIVYFAAMTADRAVDSRCEPQPPYRRTAEGVPGAESVRSTRGRRIPTRPWRLPAVNRNPKN